MKRWILAGVLLGVAACAPATEQAGEPADAVRYEIVGEVVQVSPDDGTVTLDHEPVEDFMGAMTMPFNVPDRWVFEAAEPGARIRATLVVEGDSSWLEEVVVRNPADRGAAAEVVVQQPHPGDPVPSVSLVDQSGREFDFDRYEGRWWVFTFVYTTCPIPDFCPRISGNFADVYRAIDADPERFGDARLLSVSVDPTTDTPEVLREYGLEYLGGPEGFERWTFARAEPEPLRELAGFTGLRFLPENGEVVHSLRTVIVDPEGRAQVTLVGNRWTPAELLEALERAVAGEGHEH